MDNKSHIQEFDDSTDEESVLHGRSFRHVNTSRNVNAEYMANVLDRKNIALKSAFKLKTEKVKSVYYPETCRTYCGDQSVPLN